MGTLLLYADLHCPYAYLAHHRLRKAMAEAGEDVVVRHLSLAIEHVDEKCTPKHILDVETPLIVAEEPNLRWQPWSAPASEWPVTMWPAFEAVKCAERQGWRQADEMAWRIREAFFARSRCVSMRHVLLDLARGVPDLDHARFVEDWDAGVAKRQVIEEAREGWERLDLEVSPTFVLPSGRRLANPVAPLVHLDEATWTVARVDPAPARGEEALEEYRKMVREAARA